MLLQRTKNRPYGHRFHIDNAVDTLSESETSVAVVIAKLPTGEKCTGKTLQHYASRLRNNPVAMAL